MKEATLRTPSSKQVTPCCFSTLGLITSRATARRVDIMLPIDKNMGDLGHCVIILFFLV